MNKIGYYLGLGLVVTGLLYGCTDSGTDKPVSTVDTVMSDTLKQVLKSDTLVAKKESSLMFSLSATDKVVLDVVDKINMGFSFNKVKENYPLVKGIRPEEKKDDLATAGLTESVCKQPLFGGTASAEFNFRNDSTYSYYFTYSDKNFKKTEQVYYSIMDYYSEKYGDPNPENVEEENHYSQNYVWPAVKNVVFYVNYNLNTGVIVWGKRIERHL